MDINSSDLIYLRELLNTASTKKLTEITEGYSTEYMDGFIDAVVICLKHVLTAIGQPGLQSTDELKNEAMERARIVITSGQDWRREVRLFENLRMRFI